MTLRREKATTGASGESVIPIPLAMTTYHLYPTSEGWLLFKDANPALVLRTLAKERDEAIREARKWATFRDPGASLSVHRSDGSVENAD